MLPIITPQKAYDTMIDDDLAETTAQLPGDADKLETDDLVEMAPHLPTDETDIRGGCRQLLRRVRIAVRREWTQ